MVTLEWNYEDIADVYASQYRDEEPYFQFERPGQRSLVNGEIEQSFDLVLNAAEEEIGISGGRTVSYYHRAMLSLASIDLKYAELGTEVIVLWGDSGCRQKRIRAQVAPLPFNTDYSNRNYDVEKVPHYCSK
jgi:glycine cleavage system aminomethyltransferase T